VKLLAKFNVVLILVFGLGMGLIAHYARNFLMDNAEQQVVQQAELMAASAAATKDYTANQVSSLLMTASAEKPAEAAAATPDATPPAATATRAGTPAPAPEQPAPAQPLSTEFHPQMIPFYAANETFRLLRTTHPDYVLRNAALNPTNLNDRATEWEVDLIDYFRDHPAETRRVGHRETATGTALWVATPVAADPNCLECHSLPSLAPPAMLVRYGHEHGFGWNPHEIVGAQIVSVPMTLPIALAERGFRDLMIGLCAIFLLTVGLIDAAMYLLVIRPLRLVSLNADRISKGEMELPALKVKGKDEIAEVTASFNRMHTSLVKAFEMLNG
jgi:protein-histidine pros-kinase